MNINFNGFNGKKKIVLLILAFALLAPLVILSFSYSFFDFRSSARTEKIDPKFAKANLNSDDKIDLKDFEIWLDHFNKVKRNSSYYVAVADINDNNKIDLLDLDAWIGLFQDYQKWLFEPIDTPSDRS